MKINKRKLLFSSCILFAGISIMFAALCFNYGPFLSNGAVVYALDQDGSGTGTETDPYLIGSAAVFDSAAMRNNFAKTNTHFKLINDINLEGLYWNPITTFAENCVLDGNGKIISNLTTNITGNAGLFGRVNSGTIRNLTLKNVNITRGSSAGSLASIVSGTTTCTNVYVEGGIIQNTGNRTGGLFGQVTGAVNLVIDKCYADSFTMTNTGNSTGGLLGLYESSVGNDNSIKITNSYHTGNLSGNSNIVGGIMGGTSSSNVIITLENCFHKGTIYSNGYLVGGIIAYVTSNKVTITNCYSSASLSSAQQPNKTGGLYGGGISGTVVINTSFYDSTLYSGNISGDTAIANNSSGKDSEYMKSQDFVDLLNANSGDELWAFTPNDYPSLIVLSKHVIEFDLNYAGATTIMKSQPEQGNYLFPERPVREGYTFLGWWTQPADGELITTEMTVNKDIVKLYAHWEETIYHFNFKVTLYDDKGEEIIDAEKINELISSTDITLSGGDFVNNTINGIRNIAAYSSGYRFLRFEIDGAEISLNAVAEEFKDFGNTGPNETTFIEIKAIYQKQFSISFKSENSTNLQGNASVVINRYDKNGLVAETFRKFFDEKYYDRETNFSIGIFSALGWSAETINAGNSFDGYKFSLDDNVDIGIIMAPSTDAVTLKLQSNIDSLLPYQSENSSNTFIGSETNAGRVLTDLNSDYTLIGWEVYINDNASPLDYSFNENNIDQNLNILALDIADIISTAEISGIADVSTITLKAIWQRNVGIEIIYINGSKPEMGNVEVFRDGNKIEVLEAENNDTLEFKLKANPHYEYIDNNGFTNGVLTVAINGIIKIYPEFRPVVYSVTNNNKNANLKNDSIVLNDNIRIDLNIGFGSEIDKSSLNLKIGEQPVKAEYFKLQGNSLIINANEAFLTEFASIDKKLSISIDYSTKMNGLLIGIIGGSGGLIIAAAILITLYMLALKKRKVQLQKAEEQHRIGNARLSASDTIKNLRDEG